VSSLICIAGGIASGKTTLAEALERALPDSVRLAFGDVVRSRAVAEGKELTRSNLQDIGLQLVAEGWQTFVNELLQALNGEPDVLIVEGIRHREAVGALRDRFPKRELLLVYLVVGNDQQRRRLAQIGETEGALDHNIEQDVDVLRAIADLVVQAEYPTDELVRLVRQRVDHSVGEVRVDL
jgi:dephospho-CoA kinase